MAKLNVVIPAVEVTVDVEGKAVTYRKVDRKAQVGDIVKALMDVDLAIVEDEFYGPVYADSDGDLGFDDNEEVFRWMQLRSYAERYEVYAPISEPVAETPTDTITFEGAEWRKVDRPAREGDAIRFTDEDRPSYLTESELYVVTDVDVDDATVFITDDDGDEIDVDGHDYEIYEKVVVGYREVKRWAKIGERIRIIDRPSIESRYHNGDEFVVNDVDGDGDVRITAAGLDRVCVFLHEYVVLEPVNVEPTKKAEPERLAVGDYARVTTIDDIDGSAPVSYVNVGDIFEISEDDKTSVPYYGKRVTDGKTACLMAERLVRATDEEVAAAKDPRSQFAIGDYVKVADEYCEHNVGDVLKITNRGGVHDFAVTNVATNRCGFIYANKIVKLTAAEVAEIERKQAEEAKWAAIGRKVNEYKRGDIVSGIGMHTHKHEIGTVKDVSSTLVGVDREGNRYSAMKIEEVTLIVPVEQRFDTKEVDAA